MSQKDKVVKVINSISKERFSRKEIADLSGASNVLVGNICNQMVNDGELVQMKEGRNIVYRLADGGNNKNDDSKSNVNYIDVNDRFKFIEKFTTMVVKGISPSLLLTGQAGIGKTHTVTDTVRKLGLIENEDYIILKGHSSPMGLYGALYFNQDKLIILDDCDSCWRDPIAVNILKAALDSYGKRIVSWNSIAAERNDMEPSFEFTGSIIFISNIDSRRLDSAVVNRTITCNLSMTNLEIMDRIEALLPNLNPNITMEKKIEVLEFMKEKHNHFQGLSIRTFLQASRIRHAEDESWQSMILYTL